MTGVHKKKKVWLPTVYFHIQPPTPRKNLSKKCHAQSHSYVPKMQPANKKAFSTSPKNCFQFPPIFLLLLLSLPLSAPPLFSSIDWLSTFRYRRYRGGGGRRDFLAPLVLLLLLLLFFFSVGRRKRRGGGGGERSTEEERTDQSNERRLGRGREEEEEEEEEEERSERARLRGRRRREEE